MRAQSRIECCSTGLVSCLSYSFVIQQLTFLLNNGWMSVTLPAILGIIIPALLGGSYRRETLHYTMLICLSFIRTHVSTCVFVPQ